VDDIRLETKVERDAKDYKPDGPPLARVVAKLKAGKPVTVVTMGDSLTDVRHNANQKTNWPTLLAEALKARYKSAVAVHNPAIGGTAKEGESYLLKNISEESAAKIDPLQPISCIPMKIKEHTIGVISIYSLFVQKNSYSNIDYELFSLLAGHAATAIFSSKLYTQSERKLTTIQSFLDLLKEKPRK
jgi:hypothetical protein